MINNIKTVFNMLKELNYILNKKQMRYAVGVLFVIIVSSGFELIGVSALLPFVQAILTPDELMKNSVVSNITRKLGINSGTELVLLMGIGLMLVYIIKNLYMLASYYIQADFATKIQKQLSVKMLDSYMKRPYSYYLDVNSSEILRGCGSDVSGVYTIITNLCTILAELLAAAVISIYIFYTDLLIAVGVIVLVLVVLIGMLLVFKPIMKRAGKKSREAAALTNKAIYQAVNGIKEIYVMQRKDKFIEKYEDASEINRKAQRINTFASNCPERIIEGICVSGLIGVVCLRLMLNVNMVEFVPKLAVFAMAAFKIMPSIGKITSRINALVFNREMIGNVYRTMKDADEYEYEYNKYVSEQGVSEAEWNSNINFEKELVIKHVFWKYKNQKEPVLLDADLTIHKGESVAFIGASGAGKTTLSDIVLGLFHPQQGSVLMDEKDIFAMPEIWARIVGYVPQAVYLIDDTVRNNVAFGIKPSEIKDEQIWDALEKAQLKAFIESLPKQLDTIVGERGIKFSGGQKQRIAIARALYNRPEILVLDEATAALDNETESAVMESIEALQGQMTMIIVAHRLTTIRKCDVIYEIKEGRTLVRKKEEVLGEHSK